MVGAVSSGQVGHGVGEGGGWEWQSERSEEHTSLFLETGLRLWETSLFLETGLRLWEPSLFLNKWVGSESSLFNHVWVRLGEFTILYNDGVLLGLLEFTLLGNKSVVLWEPSFFGHEPIWLGKPSFLRHECRLWESLLWNEWVRLRSSLFNHDTGLWLRETSFLRNESFRLGESSWFKSERIWLRELSVFYNDGILLRLSEFSFLWHKRLGNSSFFNEEWVGLTV
uniref:Uncharacterized protein n=1 Tax=Cacopsylla melanoneura TaxID=428564 RepID=A0A8D8LHS8_9HEMI